MRGKDIKCYGRTESPCKECNNHTATCHVSCEDYIEFLEIHEAEMKTIRANKDKHTKFRSCYLNESDFQTARKRRSKVFKQTKR